MFVGIAGAKTDARTGAFNGKGVIKHMKAGIQIFTPLAGRRCNTKPVEATDVFTPPVTR